MTLVGKDLSFTHELSFCFYQYTAPRSAAVQSMAIKYIPTVW